MVVLTNNFNQDSSTKDKYFDIEIHNKKYPSCYQYNVLVMLAKRLIKEDRELEESTNINNPKPCLNEELVRRIACA